MDHFTRLYAISTRTKQIRNVQITQAYLALHPEVGNDLIVVVAESGLQRWTINRYMAAPQCARPASHREVHNCNLSWLINPTESVLGSGSVLGGGCGPAHKGYIAL